MIKHGISCYNNNWHTLFPQYKVPFAWYDSYDMDLIIWSPYYEPCQIGNMYMIPYWIYSISNMVLNDNKRVWVSNVSVKWWYFTRAMNLGEKNHEKTFQIIWLTPSLIRSASNYLSGLLNFSTFITIFSNMDPIWPLHGPHKPLNKFRSYDRFLKGWKICWNFENMNFLTSILPPWWCLDTLGGCCCCCELLKALK